MNVEINRDGLTLRGILETPDTPTYDLVILMHGFTGSAGRTSDSMLYQIAERLKANGMASVRFDFNGHGLSDGKFENMTVLNEIEDGKAILDFVRQMPQIKNIHLLGHSQGGVVAGMLAGYYHDIISSLVLMAPAATLKDDAVKGSTRGLTYNPQNIPDTQTIWNGNTLGGFYLRTAQTLPIYEVSARFQKPVCIIHGTDDQVVDTIASYRYKEIWSDNSQLHLVEKADHGFSGEYRTPAVDLAIDFLSKQDTSHEK